MVSGRWVDLREAAGVLNTSTEAVRKRASRGTIPSKRAGGRVLVRVDDRPDERPGGEHDALKSASEARDELVEELRDRVVSLERRLDEERESRRRADTIIAQLTQANAALAARVPELEAPASPEPPEAPEPVQEGPEGTQPRSGTPGPQEAVQRPWWRRVFGG